MDRISPIDLERAQLRKSFRGYAAKDVDALIVGAASSLQDALKENDWLRRELEAARAELQAARSQEDTLKEALILAQKAADETRALAHKQAEQILSEARQQALAETMVVQQKLSELRWEIERLKAERRRFQEEFRHLLERYRDELDREAGLVVLEGEASA